jgi:nitrite reductase/ring-hydroxylating ferredoxin subunit
MENGDGPATPSDMIPTVNRRGFLSILSFLTMITGLAGGYGMFLSLACRFLFPAERTAKRWLFVSELSLIDVGQSILFRDPAGRRISIMRNGSEESINSFVALSRICPHLGCSVHWEPQNKRFFCPCHNGAFDTQGNPLEGPPADAGQSLDRFRLKIENGLLFIEVSAVSLVGLVSSSETKIT